LSASRWRSSAMSRHRNTSHRAATPEPAVDGTPSAVFSCAWRSDRMHGRASKSFALPNSGTARTRRWSGRRRLHAGGREHAAPICRISMIRSCFAVALPGFVRLCRARWRVEDAWRDTPELPVVVRTTVRRADRERALSVSTAALIHVDLPVTCVGQQKGQGQPGLAQPGQGQPGQGQPGLGQGQSKSDCNSAAAAPAPEQNEPDEAAAAPAVARRSRRE
jgi:hypothetical protein